MHHFFDGFKTLSDHISITKMIHNENSSDLERAATLFQSGTVYYYNACSADAVTNRVEELGVDRSQTTHRAAQSSTSIS